MKSTSLLLAAIFSSGFTAAASADTVPPRSKDFAGNYRTLVEDQKAPAAVASCIASAYDYVKQSPRYDRLGFTQVDIIAAKTNTRPAKFSEKDPRKMSAVISLTGEARIKSVGYKWDSITLRCGLVGGKLKAIELSTKRATD